MLPLIADAIEAQPFGATHGTPWDEKFKRGYAYGQGFAARLVRQLLTVGQDGE